MTTGRQTMPAGGRATFRSKSLVLLGVMVILSSMLALMASRPGMALGAGGGANALDDFTVVAPASVTAGSAFTVTVTAYDRRDRIVTDYVGGVSLSGLTASPNNSLPTQSPITWSGGVGTVSAIATRSQATATVAYTDVATSKTASASFSVAPSSPTAIAFIAQPVDTKFGEPIYSSLATATGVKVKATDAYGNPVNGVSVVVDDNNSNVALGGTKTVTTAGGTFGVSPFGEATFSTLNLPTLGTYALGAVGTYPVVNPTVTLTAGASSSFEIVADLAKCNGASCKNTGAFVSNVPQKTYGTITPGAASFNNNVVLTTQFAGDASECAGADNALVFGETTEVRVQNTVPGGTGIASTQPDFQVALLYPYQTLQALDITSRGVPSFDVCLGATWIGTSGADVGWWGKNLATGALEQLTDPDDDNVYWGWVPDCAAVTAYADNPCFELRTKSASQLQSTLGLTKNQLKALEYKSGDLALVIKKPFPWDGKFTAR